MRVRYRVEHAVHGDVIGRRLEAGHVAHRVHQRLAVMRAGARIRVPSISNSTSAGAPVIKLLPVAMALLLEYRSECRYCSGQHKLLLLELDLDLVTTIAKQAGFEVKSEDTARSLVLDLNATGRQAPLLLFDAADQAKPRLFSRCQYYVEGRTGVIMQTPITLAISATATDARFPTQSPENRKRIALQFSAARKAGHHEQIIYALLQSVLGALTKTGIAVCGGPVVQLWPDVPKDRAPKLSKNASTAVTVVVTCGLLSPTPHTIIMGQTDELESFRGE